MATIALLSWPLVAILLYRRFSLPWALALTIIGGYLLLPGQTGWNFTALPNFNKHTIPAISALVLTAMAFADRKLPGRDLYPHGWLPRDKVVLVLCIVFVFSIVGTVLTNTDSVRYGPRTLQGLRFYDILSGGQTALMVLIPFLLARRVFASSEGHRVLLAALAVAGAAYAFLALYEIRMSPQLNRMVYGFFPHEWRQHLRPGGWRPLVFLNHGLWLAIFFATASLAAFGLWRTGPEKDRRKFLGAGLLILGTLVLSNSLTGLAVALLLLPLVIYASTRTQLLVAASVSLIVLSYPTLRYADVIPTELALDAAGSISPQRAGSLEYRFVNEDILLEKAKQRPVFGWGGWGRSRAYNESGQDIAVTDGRWVIVFGLGGWVGYLSEFGLLSAAILSLAFRSRRYRPDPVTAALALVLAANLIDLVPNSGLSPVTWLMAGALAGRLELARETSAAPAAAPADARPTTRRSRSPAPKSAQAGGSPRFTRFAPSSGRKT